MRKASRELLQAMEEDSAKFYQEAHIVFADGVEKDLGMGDFYLSGNGFSDGAGTNALALGEAMAKSINMVLVNDEDQLSEYDFCRARITVWCCIDLPASTERIKIGTFTIGTPVACGGEIEISGTDDMHKGDVDYDTNLLFPATAKHVLLDSCQKCGVKLKKESFTNDSFMVLKKPTQCTHRSVWGMVAMLAGGNARMDEDNLLEIISYDLSFFARRGLDGGKFDNGEPLYQTGDSADGGNFTDYSNGDAFDGGDFEELGRYHMFYSSQTPTIDTDDVVITGVQASSGDSSGFYGAQGYVLSVENQLIAGKVQEGMSRIGELVVGMRFRPFTLDNTAYPLAEFGDICYLFDRKGNQFQSVVTDVNFSFYGYTTIKCAADSVMRNQSEYKPAAASIIADVEKWTDERFEDVGDDIDNINGEIGDINGEIRDINGEIRDINGNIGGLNISLQKTNEGLTAEVNRALSAEEKIGSRISMTESSIDLEVSRAKGEEEKLYSRISMTEESINLEVSRATAAEGSLSSRINMTAENITAEVRRAQGVENDLYSRISITADSITAEVSRATAAEGNLSSRISITADQISSKVSANDVESIIEQNADSIRMKAGNIVIDSYYFQVDKYGNITASSGEIAGFSINSSGLSSPYGSTRIYHNIVYTSELRPGSGVNDFIIGNFGTSTSIYGSSVNLTGNVYMPTVYSNNTTADPNLHITSTGYVNTKGGSSKRWKHDIYPISSEEIDPHRLYNVRTYEFIYNDDYISRNDSRRGKKIPGFLIEHLKEDYPIAVDYDEKGNLSTWSPSMFIAPIVYLLQEQNKRIENLEKLIFSGGMKC